MFEDLVPAWVREGQRRAADELTVLVDWITASPDEARAASADADKALATLRCSLIAQSAILKSIKESQGEGAAFRSVQDAMRPSFAQYVRAASAMYGSVEAAKARFDRDAPCTSLAGDRVGLAFLAAIPAAAWYAGGAVLATGAVAYAISWRASAWRDVEVSQAAERRARALAECLQAGGSQESCLRAATPTANEATASSVSTLESAGRGAEAAGRGASSAAGGAAWLVGAIGVAGLAYVWGTSK